MMRVHTQEICHPIIQALAPSCKQGLLYGHRACLSRTLYGDFNITDYYYLVNTKYGTLYLPGIKMCHVFSLIYIQFKQASFHTSVSSFVLIVSFQKKPFLSRMAFSFQVYLIEKTAALYTTVFPFRKSFIKRKEIGRMYMTHPSFSSQLLFLSLHMSGYEKRAEAPGVNIGIYYGT